MSDMLCEDCKLDPDPRGPSACAACRALADRARERVSAPEVLLAINCVECCGKAIACRFPIAMGELSGVLETKGWVLSAMSLPGTALLVGALCGDCARKVHPVFAGGARA